MEIASSITRDRTLGTSPSDWIPGATRDYDSAGSTKSTFENWAGRVGSPEDVQCRNLLGRAGTKRVSLWKRLKSPLC